MGVIKTNREDRCADCGAEFAAGSTVRWFPKIGVLCLLPCQPKRGKTEGAVSADQGDASEKTRPDLATKLRALAEGMQPSIDAKRNPAIAGQRVTARRARIARGMAQDADSLEQVQLALFALAAAHADGSVPTSLARVRSKASVDKLLTWGHGRIPRDHPERLRQAGLRSAESVGQAYADLTQLVSKGMPRETDEQMAAKLRQAQIAEMERNLIGRELPGYFPTPKAVVERMLAAADLEPGLLVLEPSAGKGNIADAVRLAQPDVQLETIEYQSVLREVLEAKNHTVVGWDFLIHTGLYDRILMNPPFEKYQDVEHVQHAYSLLRPGGLLVSIMSDSPFFRTDRKGEAFRDWLESVGGDSEKLPPGAFQSSDGPTGTPTRLVIIRKD